MVWYVSCSYIYIYIYKSIPRVSWHDDIEPDFSPKTASQEGSSTSTVTKRDECQQHGEVDMEDFWNLLKKCFPPGN